MEKIPSSMVPRPGSFLETKAVFMERAKELLGYMKSRVTKEANAEVKTQFSEDTNAPTTMIRAAVARTIASKAGHVFVATKSSHGWTISDLIHLGKRKQ